MANTPRDDFDDLDVQPTDLGFPGDETPELTAEERDFAFDEGYLDGDAAGPAAPSDRDRADAVDALASAFQSRQKREMQQKQERTDKVDALTDALRKNAGKSGAAAKEDEVYAAVVKASQNGSAAKTELSPWQRRQMTRRRKQDPVTVGEDLRSDQVLVYDSELDEIDYTDEDDLPEMRDYMPIRFKRYGRIGIGGGLLYALFVISVSIVLACMGWLFASDVLALNKEPRSAIVTIDEYQPMAGDPLVDEEGNRIQVDIDQVADALKNSGMIEYKWLFKLFSQFSHADTKIDPGTYDVSTELDYRALVTALQFGSGNQEITRITFPEGYTMEQIFALLEENHICHVSELEEAAANYDFDYDFLEGQPLGDAGRLEGYLFPDTYDFYQGESASVAINRFLRNLDNKLTGEIRSAAANRGLSVHELLTMASLIEKESGGEADRATIASAIYNRLNAGMPLQLDTTINYILGTSTLNITVADTEIDDPYNTYLYTGLPPGPICNPGLSSIEAVVNPESTDYWYWYAYEGENSFFQNYDDFINFVNSHPNS